MAVSAPTTPTFPGYVDYSTSITPTWTQTAPTGGDVIQYYQLQQASDPRGSAQAITGLQYATPQTVYGLSKTVSVNDGLFVAFRVRAAYKTGGVGVIKYTSYSGNATKYILFRGTNDFTNFTNIASNITTTFFNQDSRFNTSGTRNSGLQKTVTQNTTSSTTYTSALNYVYKDFTGLTIGRTYYVTGMGSILTASIQGNIYRLQVNTSTPTVGGSITLTTTSTALPTLTFVATSTTHRIRFELNETFTQTTTGIKEDFIVRDFSLYEVLDTPYQLQPHLQEMSVAQAFDLASQSVGGYWWVDKSNQTNFAQFPLSDVSSYTFTDEVGASGDLHYVDIQAGYDSRDIVNSVSIDNYGRVPYYDDPSLFSADTLSYLTDADTASVDEWGARAVSLTTNIYCPQTTNYVTNPSVEANLDNIFNGATSICRIRRRNTNAYALTGGDIDGVGTRLLAVISTATGTNLDPYWNAPDSTTEIFVTVGQSYTAVAYAARALSTADAQALVSLRWYNAAGDFISANSSANQTLGSLAWKKFTVTATAPANSVTATVRVIFTRSGAGNFSAGNIHLADSVGLFDGSNTDYFDGSFTDTTSYIYQWTGQEQQSSSRRYINNLFGRATDITTDFAAPEFTVKSLRWNAAEDFVQAYNLDIGQNVTVNFKGVTGIYRITGMEHDLNPESWMVTIKLGKV